MNTMTTRGFTLVELMLVIAILAVISAIIVPRIIDVRDEARKARCATNINRLEKNIERYSGEKEEYPTDISQILIPEYFPHGNPTCPFDELYEIEGDAQIKPHEH